LHSSARNHATRFSMLFNFSKHKWRPFCACSSLPTFCANFSANVFHHGAGIEPRTSPAGNVAITTGILSGTEQESLLHTRNQKRQNFKNPAPEQRSSPQGCTVRPETSNISNIHHLLLQLHTDNLGRIAKAASFFRRFGSVLNGCVDAACTHIDLQAWCWLLFKRRPLRCLNSRSILVRSSLRGEHNRHNKRWSLNSRVLREESELV
jgi:hypothetical protein